MMKLVKKIKVKTKSPRARKFVVTFLMGVLLIPTTFVMAELPNNSQPYPADLYAQCFDGVDNDGDGFADLRDIDCPKCFDGLDNEPDSFVDADDPDCPKKIGKTISQISQTEATFKQVGNLGSVALNSPPTLRTTPFGTQCRRVIVFRKIIPHPTLGFYFDYEFFCDNSLPRVGDGKLNDETRRLRRSSSLLGVGNLDVTNLKQTANLTPTSITNSSSFGVEPVLSPVGQLKSVSTSNTPSLSIVALPNNAPAVKIAEIKTVEIASNLTTINTVPNLQSVGTLRSSSLNSVGSL